MRTVKEILTQVAVDEHVIVPLLLHRLVDDAEERLGEGLGEDWHVRAVVLLGAGEDVAGFQHWFGGGEVGLHDCSWANAGATKAGA